MVSFLTRIALVLTAFGALMPELPAYAEELTHATKSYPRSARAVRTESWVEEWDPFAQRWVRAGETLHQATTAAAMGPPTWPHRAFGPFVVLDHRTAAVMGTTNGESPADFERMRAAFPHINALEFIDAPGTVQDVANLEIGRMIRAAGISTHVPANGSVRSGAVELFLAGNTRTMEPGARFAVHAWRDERGQGPNDFAADDPVNRLYIAYYEDMGMSAQDARAFYAMTNSVPHSSALWFGPEVMSRWIRKQQYSARDASPFLQLAFDPGLMFIPFPPLDDVGPKPTIRFARSHQEPLAAPEAKSVSAGT